MPSPIRALLGLSLSLALGAGLGLTSTTAARADSVITAKAGSFTISGTGYGHGWGMSQYGAYGAATQGKTWQQILAFYYPGTTLASLTAGKTLRVWITADTDNELQVYPSSGLKLRDLAAGTSYTLPTGSKYTRWRVTRSGTGFALSYRTATGSWVAQKPTLSASATWSFENTAKIVKVFLPGGAHRELRGQVSLAKNGTGGRTINRLAYEDYLKSVVPSEMPTSWSANAVRSQAVAARSYAARIQAGVSSTATYDICDTTACQVYKGYANTADGTRTVNETSGGNAAVTATAGKILKYGSTVALTQFSSSNGGHSAKGDFPYLTAKPDPYDGVIKSQAWSVTVTAAKLQTAYPTVGTVRQLQVVARDGYGKYGGRVTSIKIIGSKATVTTTGASFRSKLALRSALFTVTGAKPYDTFPRRYATTTRADLLVVNSAGTLVRYPVSSTGTLGGAVTVASGFGSYEQVINAGDWNGDGMHDVLARTSADRLLLFLGKSNGGLGAGTDLGIAAPYKSTTSVGDFNGDKFPDIVSISRAGNLWLQLGDGKTKVKQSIKLATGWGTRDWLRSPGDFTGDGRPDLFTKVGDRLYLHRGTGTSFSAAVSLGTGWNSISAITTIGDFDNDKKADLLARRSTGNITLYRGNGTGGFLGTKLVNGNYTGTRFAT